MSQHTAPAARSTIPPLLVEVARLLAAHRPAVRQTRCFTRLCALVWGRLWTIARPTITQLLLALGLTDADWSAFYRLFSVSRVDYDVLSRCFLHQTLPQVPEEGPYVVAVDGVQLPRRSLRMPGTAWLKCPRTPPWKPGINRAQRYLHLAALLPRWQGYSRALPVRFVPPPSRPKRCPGRPAADRGPSGAGRTGTPAGGVGRGGTLGAAAAGLGRWQLQRDDLVDGAAGADRAPGAHGAQPRAA
jgi:DDE superfamily endonuclease